MYGNLLDPLNQHLQVLLVGSIESGIRQVQLSTEKDLNPNNYVFDPGFEGTDVGSRTGSHVSRADSGQQCNIA